MKLTKREVQLLERLMEKSATMGEAAAALRLKKPNLAQYIKKLEKYGLLASSKKGRAKELKVRFLAMRFSESKKAFPQLRPGDVLIGYIPFLISWAGGRPDFRLKDIDLPVATSKRILAKLRNMGLFHMPKRGTYKLREEARHVARFCMDVITFSGWALAKSEINSLISISWHFESARDATAMVMATKEEKPEHFWPTYASITHLYGLQLLSAGRFYYVNFKPDLGDLIIHTLKIEHNARGVLYASFLALKNKYDVRILLRKRHMFGLEKEYLRGFAEFVQSRGKRPFAGLSSLEELRSMGYENV